MTGVQFVEQHGIAAAIFPNLQGTATIILAVPLRTWFNQIQAAPNQ